MSRFLQLHLLTAYPPANLNRDDLNRPKTAQVGGVQRLRISSQCLKRNWRMSELFAQFGEDVGKGDRGIRTRDFRELMFKPLVDGGIEPKKAAVWTDKIMDIYKKKSEDKEKKEKDKEKKEKPLDAKDRFQFGHMLFLSAQERIAIQGIVDSLISQHDPDEEMVAKALQKAHTAVDLAMFGRMLADKPDFNVDAAVQVAHAFSVQEALVEDDFFTAVDDLNTGEEDVGAGHMGSLEFGAGLFYIYICVDTRLLRENLGNHVDLAGRTARALTEAAATVAPTGKQNSFASRACAHYILAEKGDRQPRSLAAAFLKPVKVKRSGEDDPIAMAIAALTDTRQKMDSVYGNLAEAQVDMNALTGQGSLKDLLAFVEEACR